MRALREKRVLLGVTGGIAAYKAITVARRLTDAGAEVDVVLTPGALDFLRPLSFEALTGRAAYVESYGAGDPLRHIRLARDSDLLLIAPATANFIARAASGMADDLLTCVLLATEAHVIVCPAMNDRMYAHSQTQANLAALRERGYSIAGPAAGPLAWGEGEGLGRLLEPEEIVAHAARALAGKTPFTGRRVLVTAGPTREPIDPVRFLGNRSSGRMGYAVAAAAWRRGAEVTLISGPSSMEAPVGVEIRRVEVADEMRDAVAGALPEADVLVMAAAVADFRPAAKAAQKIKRSGEGLASLKLEPTVDVLETTRAARPAACVTVGFALETTDALENGRRKLREKGLDLLVLNDATEPGAGFEVETNRVTILRREGDDEPLPLLAKDDVAEEILDRIEPLLGAVRERA